MLTHFSFIVLLTSRFLFASVDSQIISFEASDSALQLASGTIGPAIYVATNELNGTIRAAQDLAIDFGRVTGQNGTIVQSNAMNSSASPAIIVGTIGSSKLIDGMVTSGKIDVSSIKGQWESYIQATVDEPVDGMSRALVIAGSDMQGSIFGIYDISETIGVLPWYFWADIPFKQSEAIYALPTTQIQGPPSVKYRGIFINDEENGLMPWASDNFPESIYGCPFTHTFYQHVFELLLRLKGNFLWPGMKKTCAFYADDDLNGPEATRYGIYVGTSHHEPMATSYAEQERDVSPFDWLTNEANVQAFFRMGAERAKNWTTMWTVGMRGDGDTENAAYTAETVQEIIDWQEALLLNVTGKPLGGIPQSWVLYKEVGKYWQAGMNVSEDVTLVWTDDSFGNLNRIPIGNETERSGGAGVYFHFEYVGAPRDWRWGNTIQNVKTWEQMQLAYERGAQDIWLVNIGDIKPLEVPISHFMAMAYDMTVFETPDSTRTWLAQWAEANIDSGLGDQIGDVITEFGLLAGRRKWEEYNGDGQPFAFNAMDYHESQSNLDRWDALVETAQALNDQLGASTQTAYFETVLYPILSGYHVVQLYSYYDFAKQWKIQGRISTNSMAAKTHAAFAADAALTEQYHSMLNGKWNKMVQQVHIGIRDHGLSTSRAGDFPPVAYISDADTKGLSIMGVIFEGRNTSLPGGSGTTQLLEVNPYLPDESTRWIDVFARQNGTFSYGITSNASFVSVSNANGTISSSDNTTDVRCFVSVDWENAPAVITIVSLTISSNDGTTVNLSLPINHVTANLTTTPSFIEADGVISMEAAHYSSATVDSYIEIPGYGRTLSGIKRWPATAPSTSAPSGPKLTYNFYTFTSRPNANIILHLGQTGNVDPDRPLRYAYAFDGGEAAEVQPVADYSMGSNPADWNQTVVDQVRYSSFVVDLTVTGQHGLDLWLLEPEVVVVKVVVDLGGVRGSYLSPEESWRVK